MISQGLTNITQEPEDYRGELVYTQEYGYKMVTMTVSVAPDEQSHVTTHIHDLPLSEDAERLQAVDLYSFSVTDGTRIQLTIETPTGNKEAWYSVERDNVVAERSSIEIDIVRSSESIPLDYAYVQEALGDALTHYADHMPDWSNETPRSSLAHDRDNFGRSGIHHARESKTNFPVSFCTRNMLRMDS